MFSEKITIIELTRIISEPFCWLDYLFYIEYATEAMEQKNLGDIIIKLFKL